MYLLPIAELDSTVDIKEETKPESLDVEEDIKPESIDNKEDTKPESLDTVEDTKCKDGFYSEDKDCIPIQFAYLVSFLHGVRGSPINHKLLTLVEIQERAISKKIRYQVHFCIYNLESVE